MVAYRKAHIPIFVITGAPSTAHSPKLIPFSRGFTVLASLASCLYTVRCRVCLPLCSRCCCFLPSRSMFWSKETRAAVLPRVTEDKVDEPNPSCDNKGPHRWPEWDVFQSASKQWTSNGQWCIERFIQKALPNAYLFRTDLIWRNWRYLRKPTWLLFGFTCCRSLCPS